MHEDFLLSIMLLRSRFWLGWTNARDKTHRSIV